MEVELEGVDKIQFDEQHQEVLKEGLVHLMPTLTSTDQVTFVSVMNSEGDVVGIRVEVELESDCMVPPKDNFVAIDKLEKVTDSLAAVLNASGVGRMSDIKSVNVTSKAKDVTYQRVGWMQVRVNKAVNVFANRNERELGLRLRVGETEVATETRAVFKGQPVIFDQHFEFAGIRAQDSHLKFTICAGNKKIESCKLDFLKDLYPGTSEVEFDTSVGTIEFTCTWHPRSHADRQSAAARHHVHTNASHSVAVTPRSSRAAQAMRSARMTAAKTQSSTNLVGSSGAKLGVPNLNVMMPPPSVDDGSNVHIETTWSSSGTVSTPRVKIMSARAAATPR